MMVTIATFLDALEIHVSEVADYCRKTIPKENRKFAHFNLQEILAVGKHGYFYKGDRGFGC